MNNEDEVNPQVTSNQQVAPEGEVPVTSEDDVYRQIAANVDREVEQKEKYGDSPFIAGGLAAADSATFSLFGRALKKLGIATQEDLQGYAKQNPEMDVIGSVLGVVAPAIATGGASAIAQTGAKGALATGARVAAAPALGTMKAGAAVEKLVASTLAKSTAKSAMKDVLKASLAKGAGGAVEGAGFGVGQYLREDSLGSTELNGENLLAAAGMGALYGGLINASLPVIGKGLTVTGKGGAKVFDKFAGKYFDEELAAQELSGFTPSKILKTQAKDAMRAADGKPEFLKELPAWYRDVVKVGYADSADDIISKTASLKHSSGKSIETVLRTADDVAKTRIAATSVDPRLRPTLFNKIADDIEANFHRPYKDLKSMSSQNRKVKNLIDDIRTQANNGKPLTGADLVEQKRILDKIISEFSEVMPGQRAKLAQEAAWKARKLMNEASHSYVSYIDTDLAAELASANRNFHYASEVLPYLQQKALRDKSFFNFKDALFGAVGYSLADTTGLGLLSVKKFLDSDLRRKLVIMSGIKNNTDVIAKKIGNSIDSFISTTGKATKTASLQMILNSPLAKNEDTNSAPKNKKEAYDNISKKLIEFSTEPEKLMERTIKAGASISPAAPKTAEEVGLKLVRATQFLQSKIPKRPYEAEIPGMKPRPYEPSSMEISKFERYLQAVEQPLSILDDLESNAITKEHIEAIQAVYPRLYQNIREIALERMRNSSDVQLPYQKRVQISMLLSLHGDSSLLGKNIAALQQNFSVNEQPDGSVEPVVQPTQGGAGNINQAERSATETQSFIQRRNSR